MPNLSSAELAIIQARQSPKLRVSSSGEFDESLLQQRIVEECRRRGWLAFRGSMAHKTFRTKGEPDFHIYADEGRVFTVECKTRTGKLSSEQLGVIVWASKLGHVVHVVRSFEEFLEVVDYGRAK